MDVIVIQMLVFLAILFLVLGLNAVVRKEDVTLPGAKPLMFRVFHSEVGTVGKMTGPWADHAFPMQARQLRNDIIAGALPLEVSEIRGMQGFGGAVIAAITCIMVFVLSMNWAYAVLVGLLFGLLAWYYPVAWVSRKAVERKNKMSKGMPYAIDLITVAMEAGQDFGAAVRNLVNDGPHGHRAERQAARAPSLMLIPTALFILPAVFIIIVTPIIIRAKDSGLSTYFKGGGG